LLILVFTYYKQDVIIDYANEFKEKFTDNSLESETEKAIEYADSLQNAIVEFEQNRENVNVNIANSTTETLSELEIIQNSKLRESIKKWAKKWDNVKQDFHSLKSSFENVQTTSNRYFGKLQDIASKINNQTLKTSEINKNTSLQESWNKVLQESLNNLNNLESIIKEGDDFYRILLGASIREKLDDSISELKNISVKAKNLLKELQTLTLEGKKLQKEI
jgi:predicted RNase H-like nuclease (RuvC/YqgF family)